MIIQVSNNVTRKGSLTAYVLIGLMKCTESLEGSLRVKTAVAEVGAVQ